MSYFGRVREILVKIYISGNMFKEIFFFLIFCWIEFVFSSCESCEFRFVSLLERVGKGR